MVARVRERGVGLQQVGAVRHTPVGFERCEVSCDAAGVPEQIAHRGHLYWRSHSPRRWFERRNWWELEDRVPRASVINAVDRERWSVQVLSRGVATPITLELVKQQATGQWWIASAFSA